MDFSNVDLTSLDWESLKDSAIEAMLDFIKKESGDLSQYAKGKIQEKWRAVDWSGSRKKYKDNLVDTLSTVKILGHPKPLKIETIYTDCYVFDRMSALSRFSDGMDSLQKGDFEHIGNRERLSALEIAKTGESLFILGRPGAGKTTFLKYLAILACKDIISKTPIFITLKDWSDSNLAIEEYIAKQFDLCGFPKAESFVKALLSRGDAVVLLDGLDEVGEENSKRAQTTKEIVNLSLKYRKCQFCLTCRIAATDYSFERFKYLEVADFTTAQQEYFLAQWYGGNSTQLQRFLVGWQDNDSAGIRDLGKTPLLLTLLCLAYDETFQFPTRQVDLYREALDALLRKWDASRLIGRDTFYKNLSFSRREHLLEHIAAHFYFNAKTVFLKKDVEDQISHFLKGLPDKEKADEADAGVVLKQIEAQHGLIVERAKGIYSFSHLTLQEYFTASYLIKAHNEQLLDQVVEIALKDQKWREVVLYTVALLPTADPILERMAKQLAVMRGTEQGVVRFLAYCYCESLTRSPTARHVDGFSPSEIIEKILTKSCNQNHPSITGSETAKISEHLSKIKNFLLSRAKKYDFGNAAKIFTIAFELISEQPNMVAKLLGGHRARPDEFTEYLYASRLMIECLEVAVSNERDGYLQSVLSLNDDSVLRAAELM